jgi:cleavage and polyadenylation specificity factor subunit 3
MSAVDVKQTDTTEVTVEWVGGSTNDMIADSVVALLLGIDRSPASVKSESSPS